MPTQKGHPSKLFTALAELAAVRPGKELRLSADAQRLSGVTIEQKTNPPDQETNSPVKRSKIIHMLKEAGASQQTVEEIQKWTEGKIPPRHITELLINRYFKPTIDSYRVECSVCGERFVPRLRRRRWSAQGRRLKMYCGDCRKKVKRKADRDRLRKKREKGWPVRRKPH